MSNTAVPMHDFSDSTEAAHSDADLKAQLIKHFKTADIVGSGKSELVDATCDLVNWVLQQARARYGQHPERLVSVISAAPDVANALAAWSSTKRDWIVLSEGLITMLRDSSDAIAGRVESTFPWVLDSQLGKKLQSVPPLRGGFKTSFGSLLYFAAIAFFVGHEAGHHLEGHDGYYLDGAHAEAGDEAQGIAAMPKTVEQALEFDADRVGVSICRIVMMQCLGQLWDCRQYNEAEMRDCQRVLAVLLSAGALMAVVRIMPRTIVWTEVGGSTHPPAVLRILGISVVLTDAIKANFGKLPDSTRRWIRLMSLELAVEGTIKRSTKEEMVFQERKVRGGEPAALRAVGIRKALHDPQVGPYLKEIQRSIETIRPRLRPRK